MHGRGPRKADVTWITMSSLNVNDQYMNAGSTQENVSKEEVFTGRWIRLYIPY